MSNNMQKPVLSTDPVIKYLVAGFVLIAVSLCAVAGGVTYLFADEIRGHLGIARRESVRQVSIPSEEADEALAIPKVVGPEEEPEDNTSAASLYNIDFPNREVPDAVKLNEYQFLWRRIREYWGERNTDGQTMQALQIIYKAKQYYPEMTMLYAMTSLSEQIPKGFSVVSESEAEGVAVGREQTEKGFTNSAVAARVRGKEVSTVKEEAESILVVAQDTYNSLEENYYAPIVAAQEEQAAIERANAETIAANQAAARARGIQRNRARQDAQAGAAAAQQAARERGADWSAQQREKQRAKGWLR